MSKSKIQGRAVRENKDGRKKKVGGASVLTTMKAFKDWFVMRTKKEGSEVTVEEARQMIQRKEPVILSM